MLSQRFNSMIFAERELGDLFEVCFDFKDFCNIGVYLLSLLPLFNSPGSSPAPASSPCCGLLCVHLELAGLAWPRLCWAAAEGRQCKGHSFSPAVARSHRLGDADSSSGETAGSSSMGR